MDITLGPGECITPCDITALFTSVSVEPVLNIVQNKLEKDQELHLWTKLMVQFIIELLGFASRIPIFSSRVSIMNNWRE